jgi:hypothetical protein
MKTNNPFIVSERILILNELHVLKKYRKYPFVELLKMDLFTYLSSSGRELMCRADIAMFPNGTVVKSRWTDSWYQ